MRERGGGAIVNVSSTRRASARRPAMPNYSVTKAAVLSLSRLVADLYAKDGIRCNAVTPGPTATDGLARRGRARRPAGGAERQDARRGARGGRRRPAARPARRAGGDRRGDRLPLLGPRRATSPAPRGAPTAAPSRSSSRLRRACPSSPGRVADAFEARVREHEERVALAARRPLVRDARARARGGRSAGCARRSSATATASCTRSRSAG